jgi:hypothetical protein
MGRIKKSQAMRRVLIKQTKTHKVRNLAQDKQSKTSPRTYPPLHASVAYHFLRLHKGRSQKKALAALQESELAGDNKEELLKLRSLQLSSGLQRTIKCLKLKSPKPKFHPWGIIGTPDAISYPNVPVEIKELNLNCRCHNTEQLFHEGKVKTKSMSQLTIGKWQSYAYSLIYQSLVSKMILVDYKSKTIEIRELKSTKTIRGQLLQAIINYQQLLRKYRMDYA